jgi:ABC-2 type transport system ATP-binding protein
LQFFIVSVKIQHLSKLYGNQKAVDDISFEAGRGEILGFLGPNGAGKSTTMKIATCYLPPSSGKVKVCGYDVMEQPLQVRKQVGYLPEHNPLYLDMYVHEYLQFIGALYQLKGKALRERVKEMVELCGLTIEQNKKLGELSKGYRQRVGLAQALIHDPAVLILDEPTTGLDPNQLVEIRNLIKRISRQKTVIFSTHIMQEVQALCDRVIIINRGSIVADSPVSELRHMSRGLNEITVEFLHPVEGSLLREIDGVEEVEQSSTQKFILQADSAKDIRPAIFHLAVKNNWTMIGLQQQEKSLEHIFRQLTT